MTKRFMAGFAALACLVSGAARVRAEYIVTDLGNLGGPNSYAYGINDAGQVVGESNNIAGQMAPFLYSNGKMINLSPSNGGMATAINASGQVAGLLGSGSAFLYSGGTTTTQQLGPNLTPLGINDAGQVVGREMEVGSFKPFLYSGGKMTLLPDLGIGGEARGINNAGQISMTMYGGASGNHAILYSGGTSTDLGTLGGKGAEAWGINNAGQMSGSSTTASGQTHAFLYSNGKMTDLGSLSGGGDTHGRGLNGAGQVVGYGTTGPNGTGRQYAFLFQNGKLFDLNSMISPESHWYLFEAAAINNRGQIVGYGTHGSGDFHAFLLTPVSAPEPGSLTLLSLGALGLAGHAWRKRRRAAAHHPASEAARGGMSPR
jgi:probable HAF family extracellular repeat protein